MNYIKSNAMPLIIGAAIGYYLAKHGGLGGVTSKLKASTGV